MQCNYCQKKIDEDSQFCEHCGQKIKRNTINTNLAKKETKITISILIFVLCSLLFYHELKYFNSPEYAIQTHLKNWKNQNYDIILADLNIETTTFTTKDFFKSSFKERNEFNLIDFKVNKCESKNNSKTIICDIKYQTSNSAIEHTKSYELQEKEEKKLLLFTDWIIKNNDFEIANDWELFLPTNATGILEGIDLKNYRNSSGDITGYDSYKIPSIFKGNYNLKVNMPNGMSLNTVIKVNNTSYKYQFTLNDISDEFQEYLKDLGINVIETFYKGIASNQKWEEIKSTYDITKLEENFNFLKNNISKEITLKDFKVKEIKISNLKMNEEGNIDITYQMNYEYTIEYLENKTKKNHQGSSNDTFSITLKNTDLNKIENIESLITYFSKKY